MHSTRNIDGIRGRLLGALVDESELDLHRIVLESRAERDAEDEGTFLDLGHEGRFGHEATFDHLAPHEEPLLWVADGIAWAFGAGGDWKRRIEPVLAAVRIIDP